MKLHSFANNRTVLIFNGGTTEVFFSYETPVAGFSDKLVWVKTDKWYSSTTTRHINKYLTDANVNPKEAKEVSQSTINDLLKEQIPTRY